MVLAHQSRLLSTDYAIIQDSKLINVLVWQYRGIEGQSNCMISCAGLHQSGLGYFLLTVGV